MKVPAGPCPECGECPRPPPRHRRDTLGRHLQTGQHARPLHHPGPLPLHEVAASPVADVVIVEEDRLILEMTRPFSHCDSFIVI